MSIVDTKTASTSTDLANGHADLQAIHMLDGFEENIAFNPSTVCFLEYKEKVNDAVAKYNISGQGLDLQAMAGGRLFSIEEMGSSYQIFASEKSGVLIVTKHLAHGKDRHNNPYLYPDLDSKNKNWNILSVDQSSSQYFGIKPEKSASGYYWTTMYAGFPFKASSSDDTINFLAMAAQIFFLLLISLVSVILIYNLFQLSFAERCSGLNSMGQTPQSPQTTMADQQACRHVTGAVPLARAGT